MSAAVDVEEYASWLYVPYRATLEKDWPDWRERMAEHQSRELMARVAADGYQLTSDVEDEMVEPLWSITVTTDTETTVQLATETIARGHLLGFWSEGILGEATPRPQGPLPAPSMLLLRFTVQAAQ